MRNQNYTIRGPETKAEWDIIPGLLMAYRNEFDDDTCFTSFEADMADIRNTYTMSGSHLLVAIDNINQEIAGCVAMRTLSPGVAEMKRLYVSPVHRGHQLGKKLAEEIMMYAKLNNYKSMLLDTMPAMIAARHLYQQLGFGIIAPYACQDTTKVICYQKLFS